MTRLVVWWPGKFTPQASLHWLPCIYQSHLRETWQRKFHKLIYVCGSICLIMWFTWTSEEVLGKHFENRKGRQNCDFWYLFVEDKFLMKNIFKLSCKLALCCPASKCLCFSIVLLSHFNADLCLFPKQVKKPATGSAQTRRPMTLVGGVNLPSPS